MKLLFSAGAIVAAVLLSPSIGLAHSECHQSMKDMLDGTLEVVGEVESENREAMPAETCTLAGYQDGTTIVASV
ncbi:MAG: hypothetical protein AAF543_03875 [Pseudomonadota bacterium]